MGKNWWLGNWWMGSGPTVAPGLPLEEQLRELVAVQLATITVANGYNQDVTVHRPPMSAMELNPSDCPAVSVRSAVRDGRLHLRRAEEFIIEFEILCAVSAAGAEPWRDIAKLTADVRRLVYANRLWNDGATNLAVKTWFPGDTVHEPEVSEKTISSKVVFMVKARSSQADPSQVKGV